MKLLDGQIIAEEIKSDLARKISKLDRKPGLAVILIGDDKASSVYVRLKEKACRETGIEFHKYLCSNNDSQESIIEMIDFLNKDKNIDGIIVQLPLPQEFNTDKILKTIDTKKDVDGFISKKVTPPTINAIIELLKSTGEELSGKKTLIIGKSDIFLSGIRDFLKRELKIGSVKIENKIPKNSNQYDIIIIALGQAGVLKEKDIKEDVIIIDVGINKVAGEIVGDADKSVREKASYLSPVPGGVGPVTVALLLKNVYKLAIKEKTVE